MGVQSGREGAGGGNAIACTACGLTFFPACPLEGDAMRAALERMRGGGGDLFIVEYWPRVQLEAKDGKILPARSCEGFLPNTASPAKLPR